MIPKKIHSPALSIAPMLDRTDRHFRYVMRLLTTHTLLYSEMITTGALLHGDRDRHLRRSSIDSPVALQLGGDDPAALAECAAMGVDYGYNEINLNVGCPSDRVQKGRFGAILMRDPEQVARCVDAMKARVEVPVTVKHRIGVDDLDGYEDLVKFVEVVSRSGADRFTVHARKAWLKGLSPKENRNVPPLRYSDVYQLKRDLQNEQIEINGGVHTLEDTKNHLKHVDAVMIGRAAVDNPYLFATADQEIFGSTAPIKTREQLLHQMVGYARDQQQAGVRFHHVARHLLHLFRGMSGSRAWRRALTEESTSGRCDPEIFLTAMPR